MKGMLFTEFLEMGESKFGLHVVNKINIDGSKVQFIITINE